MTRDGSIVAAPCWVPGMRRLFYVTYKFGNADIVWHDLATGAREMFAHHTGSNITRRFLPTDGGRHDPQQGRQPRPLRGGRQRRQPAVVDPTREDESSPGWSPDGQTLCFATRISGRRLLATIPATGAPQTALPPRAFRIHRNPTGRPTAMDRVHGPDAELRDLCVPATGGEASSTFR
jgi:hypothetical protein